MKPALVALPALLAFYPARLKLARSAASFRSAPGGCQPLRGERQSILLIAFLAFSIFHFQFSVLGAAQLPRPLEPIAAALEPTRSIVYKEIAGRKLRLHLFEPAGHQSTDRRPAFVSIHGGGWTGLDSRRNYPFAHHFAELGMLGISVEYRLATKDKSTTVSDCVRDARSAIRYVRAHARELGIDPARLAVSGNSAGGHLAVATALFDDVNESGDDLSISPRPDLLVLYYPVIETSADGYGQAKIDERWKELSPVHQVRPGLPPTLLLHGTGDTVTPFAGAKAFHEKSLSAGNECELIAHPNGRHGYFIFDLALYREAMQQTEDFLAKTGYLESSAAARNAHPLRLRLPPELFAVAGAQTTVDFDNAVLTETPGAYRFEVNCGLGSSGEKRWTATPAPAQTGDYPLVLTASNSDGKLLSWATTTLRVLPADAGKNRAIRLLVVGDSLTNASLYPNEIARLLSSPGNPKWTMLGTHRPAKAAEGVAHEGYGGWSWVRFVSRYEAEPRTDGRKGTSPFVYLDDAGKPALNVARYIEEECGGDPPDFVTFLLGINDCFAADPEDPDPKIDAMLAQAEILLAAFRSAAPDAELGVCLTTPPNAREEGFQASYKGRYSRWNWKKIQHRLVERELAEFSGREAENIFIVPTNLHLDPETGYPANNGVHPNGSGYKQIGASIYAWLKFRLQGAAGRSR